MWNRVYCFAFGVLSDDGERVEEDAHNLSARYMGTVGRMYAF